MSKISSSHDFVRILKASSDPPLPNGPTKIEIAADIWDNSSFYVPEKEKVIAEWILTCFTKDKSSELETNSLLDLRYWTLLDVILSSVGHRTPKPSSSIGAWLGPILNRLSLAPIVISFFRWHDKTIRETWHRLVQVASRCLEILWSIPTQRMPSDVTLDCLGAFLQSHSTSRRDDATDVGLTITRAYRLSLANNPNKKKLYTHFINSHLSTWLTFILSAPRDKLYEDVYEVGVDTLYNVDSLRQPQDFHEGGTFFIKLISTCSTSEQLFGALPRLFCSFVHATKRHRGSVYGQGSNSSNTAVEDASVAAVHFLSSCLHALDTISNILAAWTARLELLKVAERENVLQSNFSAVNILLSQITALIMDTLSNSSPDTQREYAAECLLVVSRIDYTHLVSLVPQIINSLLTEKGQVTAEFLEVSLAYHSKTRTLDVYLSNLLSAVDLSNFRAKDSDTSRVYAIASTGPLFQQAHTEGLSSSIRMFLTAGQVHDTAEVICSGIKSLWNNLCDLHKGQSKKSRKSGTEGDSDIRHDIDTLAISLSLTSKLASMILPSLPLRSLTDASASHVSQLVYNTRVSVIEPALEKSLESVGKPDKVPWSVQVVLAALLGLGYAMDTAHFSLNPSVYQQKPEVLNRLLQIPFGNVVTELSLNTFRALLHNIVVNNGTLAQETLDVILRYLEDVDIRSHTELPGQDPVLNPRIQTAPVLLYTLSQRWTAIMEIYASDTQLERFINLLLLSQGNRIGNASTQQPGECDPLTQLTRTAHFWEMPRLRAILLSLIDAATTCLDSFQDRANASDIPDILKGVSIYELLLVVPMEYLSKTLRIELIKRAVLADVALQALDGQYIETATLLRSFLKRACAVSGFPEHPYGALMFVQHLIFNGPADGSSSRVYVSATLELIELIFSNTWKAACKGDTEPLLLILQSYTTRGASDNDKARNPLYLRALIKIIDVMRSGPAVSSLPDQLKSILRDIFGVQSSITRPRIEKLDLNSTVAQNARPGDVIASWHALLALATWLELPGPDIPLLGDKLCTRLGKQPQLAGSEYWEDAYVHSFALMLQEGPFHPEQNRDEHWRLLLATYALGGSTVTQKSLRRMDQYIYTFCKNATITHYLSLMELISASLKDESLGSDVLVRLTALAILVLAEHPQGSLKQIQQFAAQTITTFSTREVFVEGPEELRLGILEFTLRHCADRPSFLRSADLNTILELLSKLLCPSLTHDQTTSAAIFHKIVGVLNVLVRLRRDLITLALPHFGLILRRLIFSLRSCRPHLGAKQTKLIMDTQPQWLTAQQPLGHEQAKALGRLLETLTVKTVPRKHTSIPGSQKAESIAKAFSKHSAYVLKAYIEVMNDPLCLLSSATRKQIAPGLYALCSMMSVHSRDSLMASGLDAGGKATLKALWKDYEKQKYVGQG
ncbi:hypothetical protein AX16_005564 [Volvariella volvacea WC 439]|nr:hypothetical protein AX16_005564 [Volvariella volvacea WC 439]